MKDLNKGILLIKYNYLNLPSSITYNDDHIVDYIYDATGKKLRVEYNVNDLVVFEPGFHLDDEAFPLSNEENMPALSSISPSLNPSGTNSGSNIIDGGALTPIDKQSREKTRDYCGNYIYMNDKIERIITENGYIDADGKFHFYVKDYQGNNRMTVDEHGYTEGLTSYYPNGMPFADQNGDDRYKYSGKELDTTNGLNQYDFEARQQDFALGQFTSIDPMAEKYYATSPYAYCAGNPILYVDPNGEDVAIINVGDGMHLAILIQNKDKTWSYYSVNGDNMHSSGSGSTSGSSASSSSSFSGGDTKDNLGEGETYGSPQEFLDSEFNKNGYGYTEAYVLSATFEQDRKVESTFKKKSSENYNLTSNNCATAVQESISSIGYKTASTHNLTIDPSIGLTTTIQKNSYVPSFAYRAIVVNNPQGKILFKNKKR